VTEVMHPARDSLCSSGGGPASSAAAAASSTEADASRWQDVAAEMRAVDDQWADGKTGGRASEWCLGGVVLCVI
jgi:hypothetical protein